MTDKQGHDETRLAKYLNKLDGGELIEPTEELLDQLPPEEHLEEHEPLPSNELADVIPQCSTETAPKPEAASTSEVHSEKNELMRVDKDLEILALKQRLNQTQQMYLKAKLEVSERETMILQYMERDLKASKQELIKIAKNNKS